MPKKHTGRAIRGSQFHLQNLVNENPKHLNQAIWACSPTLKAWAASNPVWVSPLEAGDYEEYRDRRFLERVNCSEFAPLLRTFWPRGGPVWDGLASLTGKDKSKGVILLEAKSHIGEVISPYYSCKASLKSRSRISDSINMVKSALGVGNEYDWLGDVYQHANRIAHLYFMRQIAQVPTWLVYLYFLGDIEQQGPQEQEEYQEVLSVVKSKLGLTNSHMLSDYIVTVFLRF